MLKDRIFALLKSRSTLIYMVSEEEDRVDQAITKCAANFKNLPVYRWSSVEGLVLGNNLEADLFDPVDALSQFIKMEIPGLLIFRDLHLLLAEANVKLIRIIKDSRMKLRRTGKKIFFPAPRLSLPDELYSHFKIVDIPLPTSEELSNLLDVCIQSKKHKQKLLLSMSQDIREKIIRASMGFTYHEAMDAFDNALLASDTLSLKTIDLVLEEKRGMVAKSGVLEYVDSQAGAWEIGGLDNLKKWLLERDRAYTSGAGDLHLTPPKGILVMGVSGCGKSLCIKAIASHWKLPLLRLDMGKIYDGLAGPPEEAMRKAIKTSEAVAPCVLWIDEIEAGIANQQQKQAGGKEARVLALFLTWMQEKTAPVFVGATANEVEVLPPEILRKGRFDELFFMGLPQKNERREILTIHLRRRKIDPSSFDLEYLAQSTEGLNGAEIEQGVIAALFESASADHDLTEHVLANSLRNIVPLSRTMRERIQKIEAWARDRAMKASRQDF